MADRFWVGGTGNWSDNTNHWSASSGGAANASKPTSADNVYFDVNSFDGADQVVTVDATAYCKDIDWTGATNSPTLLTTGPNTEIYGNCTLIAAMTCTSSGGGAIYFRAVNPQLTMNGTKNFAIYYNPGSSGTLTLLDEVNIGSQGFTVRWATLATGNFDITCGQFWAIGAVASTLNLGSSTINCTSWVMPSSNLTLNAGTSTIKVTGTGVFTGGGLTYYNVELNGTAHTISGSNTFNTLTLKADTTQTITFTDGTNQKITTPVFTGSVGKVKTLVGTGTAGWIVTKLGGGEVTCDYMDISYGDGQPQQTWIAGINSTDSGVNTQGWLFGKHWAGRRAGGWFLLRR